MTENRENSNEAKKLPPYTGTTSDGSRTGAAPRPPVKPPVKPPGAAPTVAKPPSTAFLKPEAKVSDPLRAEIERLAEGAEEEKPKIPPRPPARREPEVEPAKPESEAKPESHPKPQPDPKPEPEARPETAQPEFTGPAQEPEEIKIPDAADQRLSAEVLELLDVVSGLESLSFLRPRVEKFKSDGADLAALVSVYRLTSRTLKDELREKNNMLDQFRKEFQKQRAALDEARKKRDDPPPSRPLVDPAETEALKKQVKSLQEQVDAAQEQRNRLLQDFQNMRNRAAVDTGLQVHKEKENLIKKVLPVVDGFDRAMETVGTATDTAELARGIEMLFRIMMEALESEGLTPVATKGLPFDPRCHEAMGQVVTADMPEDSVYDELNKGYYLGERLLRPAYVRISKLPEGVVYTPPEPQAEQPSPSEEPQTASEEATGEEKVEG